MQTSIFDMLYPTYKITKPIRLIEFFAGYGSQALALKYLGVPFEHWKICEWAVKSIQAYKDMHFSDDNIDYSKDISKEQIIERLNYFGISSNYNEPMKLEQIKRLGETTLRTIFNNIVATHNLVNVQQVKGSDLEIVDTDKYDYILTYSFPCQDLSLAGTRKGMSDTSTRSGMLWEVERILDECNELGNLPQVLLMENVPQVHGLGATEDFNKWQFKLESLGYKNYWQDLIATDYGIPQTRNRCFMVSILGDYNYTFPEPTPLKLKLKDMLEDKVDEKYFLSDKMINYILKRTPIGEKDNYANNIIGNNAEKSAGTITTKGSNSGTSCRSGDNFIVDNMTQDEVDKNIYLKNIDTTETCLLKNKGTELSKITDNANTIMARDYKGFGNQEMNAVIEIKNDINYKDTENYIEWKDGKNIQMNCRAWKDDKVVATLNTGGETKILIKNATAKGYLEAEEGDGVDISTRMEYHRGTVQKGKTQTLSTMGGENNGVVVSSNIKNKNIKNAINNNKDKIENGNFIETYNESIKDDGTTSSLTTRCDLNGVIVGNDSCNKIGSIYDDERSKCQGGSIYSDENSAPTLSTAHGYAVPLIPNSLRIRKLTPKECFRLMGVKDEDFDKVAKNQSDSSLYHLAGDSIVVNVLMAIFKEMI